MIDDRTDWLLERCIIEGVADAVRLMLTLPNCPCCVTHSALARWYIIHIFNRRNIKRRHQAFGKEVSRVASKESRL